MKSLRTRRPLFAVSLVETGGTAAKTDETRAQGCAVKIGPKNIISTVASRTINRFRFEFQ